MTATTSPTGIRLDAQTRALGDAARVALRAPSIFNSQPWRWRIRPGVLELHADTARQLPATDPTGRLLVLSCGAALHHAAVALAAAGYRPEVDRLPDPEQPDLMARVRVAGVHEPSLTDLALRAAIDRRRTDRRAYGDVPLPSYAIHILRAAAEQHGAYLHLVQPDQVPILAGAVAGAAQIRMADPVYRSELIRWTNRPAWSGDGVPAGTAVRSSPRRVAAREFALGTAEGVDAGPGTDRAAAFTILFGTGDDRASWLRAGEAMSAVLLTATAAGIEASPSSEAAELETSRRYLRDLICGLGHPYLVLRLGIPAAAGPLAPVPRRPAGEVITGTG